MRNGSPFREYNAGELHIVILSEPETEYRRRWGEAIVALLHCLEKLKRLRGACSRFGGIAPRDY